MKALRRTDGISETKSNMYKDRQTSNSLYIYHERCYTSPKEWILAVDLNLGSDIHGQIRAADKKFTQPVEDWL